MRRLQSRLSARIISPVRFRRIGLQRAPSIPGDAGWSTGRLLGHLFDCLAGFCAVLVAINPERLSHFEQAAGDAG